MPKLSLFNLRITGRLVAGFTALCTILAVAVGYTVISVGGLSQLVDRMVTLRAPVALQSTEMVANLYSTLATLRGYMLTGNPMGKADRAGMWKELDATAAEIDKLVERFTNPENKRKWEEVKTVIGEFRAAQDKAEAIAFTPDAFPATKLLLTEAGPRAGTMFTEISKMIDEEERLESTAERKRLLKAMADTRGNLAAATAQIRMFLLSGEKANKDEFNRLWTAFEKGFASVSAQKALLNESQRSAFNTFVKVHGEFAPLPAKMFAIRESDEWNMPVHILVTEAAPRAAKILDLLEGTKQADRTRAGGIKSNQKHMLAEESRDVRDGVLFLTKVQWVLLAVGLGLAGLIAFLTARSIATPIRSLTGGMRELAKGNFEVVLPGVGRKDEIGEIAQAVDDFKGKLEEKMRLDAAKEQEKARIEEEQREEQARRDAEAAARLASVVNKIATSLEHVAAGDLTIRIDGEFPPEFVTLQNDFNKTVSQLQQTITAIASAAREVTNAASEIATSTTDLSQRTEEQAASLEQTSASMEQMAATVKKNAENAHQANDYANTTREVADRGGEVVGKAVDAMARIEESSRKISDIIGVIDEIAFQTNLLALNAAVEAARAGEAGRGFAVVASEVRRLAQRSSQAAKDIKELINHSSGQVQEGVDLVNRAGASLHEIVDSIKRVAAIVSDIASASAEQATGIDQVNTALNQMDEVTQQNSALVEENAATAKTLEQQSSAMSQQVSVFRLDAGAPIAVSEPRVRSLDEAPAAAAPQSTSAAAKRSIASRIGAPVRRMQAALATAMKAEPVGWKEF